MIFVVKVTTNKEEGVMDLIEDRVKRKKLEVYSVTRPHGLRGYIFLEAKDKKTAEEAAYNLQYVKGIIGTTLSYEEVENMIKPSVESMSIEEGDIVEMISEPFKKEKAKVVRVDKAKGEVVVNLLGAVVPLPVTVKMDNVRVIRREEQEGGEENGN